MVACARTLLITPEMAFQSQNPGMQLRFGPALGCLAPAAERAGKSLRCGSGGLVEADLDVLLVDPLLDLGGGGEGAPVGLEQRV